jgi:hypothetical protein
MAVATVLALLAVVLSVVAALFAFAAFGLLSTNAKRLDAVERRIAALDGHRIRTDHNVRALSSNIRGARVVFAEGDPTIQHGGA